MYVYGKFKGDFLFNIVYSFILCIIFCLCWVCDIYYLGKCNDILVKYIDIYYIYLDNFVFFFLNCDLMFCK